MTTLTGNLAGFITSDFMQIAIFAKYFLTLMFPPLQYVVYVFLTVHRVSVSYSTLCICFLQYVVYLFLIG